MRDRSSPVHVAAGLLALVCLVAPACQRRSSGGQAGESDEELLLVYVSPDPLGVNPFLIMGEEGLEHVGRELGARTVVLESQDPTTREDNVQAAVDMGADVVAVLGFEFADVLTRLAPLHPEVQFLVVDQCLPELPANVTCAVFREHDAAFLVGAMAAVLSESGSIGIVGAADIPFLHRYTEGFAAGARQVRPDVEVGVRWVGGDRPFADPVRAKEQALALAAGGTDVLFAAAAAGNFGIFEAAEEADFSVFGLDVDQCPTAPGHVIDNMMKRVDLVLERAVLAIVAGEGGGLRVYGLDSGALDLVALQDEVPPGSQCTILEHPEVMDMARELRRQIVAGEVGIEDPMGVL